MSKTQNYTIQINWTGNKGKGTASYRAYSRDHNFQGEGKPKVNCSSDPSFRGDASRYNPEELFLASIANCHMLWYLHLCSDNGIVVLKYEDHPTGKMKENKEGSGHFESVTLHPHVELSDDKMIEKALKLHAEANRMCFIANSCNFKIGHEPVATVYLNG